MNRKISQNFRFRLHTKKDIQNGVLFQTQHSLDKMYLYNTVAKLCKSPKENQSALNQGL